MPPEGFNTITVSNRVFQVIRLRAELTGKSPDKIIEELLGLNSTGGRIRNYLASLLYMPRPRARPPEEVSIGGPE